MAHYYVMNEAKTYGRVIDAPSSWDARKTLAAACQASPFDFFAIREDLMTENSWKVWDRIKNK